MTIQEAFDEVASSDCEAMGLVLANPSLDDFEIVDPATPLPAAIAENLHARQLALFGCVALSRGEFRSAFISPLPETTTRALAHAFGILVSKGSTPKSDGVDFLTKLWNLPDNRMEEN